MTETASTLDQAMTGDTIMDDTTARVSNEGVVTELVVSETGKGITSEDTSNQSNDDTNPLLMDYRVEGEGGERGGGGESDDGSSSTGDAPIDVTQFNVNWEDVREGRAAGLPSRWEEVEASQDEVPETQEEAREEEFYGEEELYRALRVKAKAYADKNWQYYWETNGPSLLAESWKSQYPTIPLQHVEEVSGLDCLCQSLVRKMQLEATSDGGEEKPEVMEGEAEEGKVALDAEVIGENVLMVELQSETKEEEELEEGEIKEEKPQAASGRMSNAEVLRLWQEFYNTHYWYTFQQYRGGDDDLEEDISSQMNDALRRGGRRRRGEEEEREEGAFDVVEDSTMNFDDNYNEDDEDIPPVKVRSVLFINIGYCVIIQSQLVGILYVKLNLS